jgi:hypothetical protein
VNLSFAFDMQAMLKSELLGQKWTGLVSVMVIFRDLEYS